MATLLAASCQPSSNFTNDEKTALAADVRQTLGNYYRDIRKLGLTAEFNYLDRSADFYWVPPGYGSALSYDSVASILKQIAPKFRLIENRFDTLRIVPLSKEPATYTARSHSTMTDTAGHTTSISLIESGVLIKRANGWKLLSGQTAVLQN